MKAAPESFIKGDLPIFAKLLLLTNKGHSRILILLQMSEVWVHVETENLILFVFPEPKPLFGFRESVVRLGKTINDKQWMRLYEN